MDDRPIPRQQVEEIIARAVELDEDDPSVPLDELRRIAQEVGLSAGALERAATEVLDRPPETASEGGVLAKTLEFLGAVVGGGLAAAFAGAGFPVLAIAIALLVAVGLASRRTWRTIARLMAQWVVLCGVFGFMAELMMSDITPTGLAALFVGGGLMAAAIVWLQERDAHRADADGPKRLPGEARDAP